MVSTAQHLTDLAVALSSRGHAVTVVTSNRGYDNPNLRFKRREQWQSITILRIPSLHLGKQTKWRRAWTFASFFCSCALRLLFLRRFDTVVVLTSPPLLSFLAALFVKVKGGRLSFWVMDLNPDEAIAAGWLPRNSWLTALLQWMLDSSLRTADEIVVLDRFVKDRIQRRVVSPSRISIIPPWSHSDVVSYSLDGRKRFREQHEIADKFVVMYSGNHSPCHSLDTLLRAALALKDRDDIVFYFIGGGSEQAKVGRFAESHHLTNIKCLPYQPLQQLSDSLSAADMHVVVMGDQFVGIVHPCKIYNIITIGTPALYIGPSSSHIMDLAPELATGQFFAAGHGEHELVVAHILQCASLSDSRFHLAHGQATAYSKEVLLPQLWSLLEAGDPRHQGILAGTVLNVTTEQEL